MPTLQPHTADSPPATAFGQEAEADTGTLPSPVLERARTADRLWRKERRRRLERLLERGRRLHHQFIRPLITVLSIVLMVPLVRLAHSPAGFGVDLASDWSLVQWCVRYVICVVFIYFPPVSIHRWVSRQFTRWEACLRQELGPAPGD